jgi:ubiquinone/menaquinone biosynthesis C-methylase UbiE
MAERYVIRGGRPGAERLAVLARSWHATTTALLERVGLSNGMRCLDLGCGGGDLTLVMARWVGPRGAAVGIDMDEVKLDVARESAAEEGLTNVTFRAMNVYDWTEPDQYDVVYCRNVLQHLSRPVDVLREMWAGVRPGGVLVVEDADFEASFCWPPNEGHAFWRDRYQRALAASGGDPWSGRKLLEHFVAAGAPIPELAVVQRVENEGEGKTMPYLTIEATAESMIAAGIATYEEVAEALASLGPFIADPQTVVGTPRIVQAWARRPAR